MSITYEQALEDSKKYFDGDDLAAKVFVDKYALRDDKSELLESNPDQSHIRLAKEFARIEKKYPNPLSEEEIYNQFKNFKKIVPQGSPMSAIGNPYQIQSASNCFVIPSPKDSYGGILFTDQEQAQVMKRRGGVGFDISNIRPKGIATKNAAKTTDGISIFMDRFSNTCREVAQNGRRGALMLTISCHHPEIRTFINIKKDKKKVTGANISIRLSDEFMNAVKNDTEVELRWPVDSKTPKVKMNVKAKEIWDDIVSAAWESAEPGILFWDNIIKNGPADIYDEFRSVSTNPCVVGDTLIAVADGRNAVSIKQLCEEKKDVIVYSTNLNSGKTEIKIGRTPRKTGDKKEIWKLTLDDGSNLIATPNHKILKENLEYIELKNLQVGDSIVSFYSFNCDGYREISGSEVNHKVVSVEYYGQEDVYNITVDDNHNYHIITSSEDDKYITSSGICVKNCGEITLSPYDSCRLMVVNLSSFVKNPFTDKAKFDYTEFSKTVQLAQRLMDDMIDIELEQIEKILNKIEADPEDKSIKKIEIDLWNNIKKACVNGRRTGLGITALGDTLAALGIQYGSVESIKKTDAIYKALAVNSEISSCVMAKERGAFPAFNRELEKGHPFLTRLLDQDDKLLELYNKHGRRNISTTTTAPVGSMSMLTQTTSGIEPAFLLAYTRRKKLLSTDQANPDFVDAMGDRWQEFPVYHHGFKEWMNISGKTKVEDSPYFKATSNEVDWVASVDIQATAQKWISHSISKTCNLPKSATKETVEQVYMRAWELGCKGFTVYRDGCRDGVLIEQKETKNETRSFTKIEKTQAPKRPKDLDCDVYHIKVKGQEYFVIVGLWEDGTPYEIFSGKNGIIAKTVKHGKLTKKARGEYCCAFDDGSQECNIAKYITDEQEAITRLASFGLRHGGDISFLVHQLEKTTGTLDSFAKVLVRVLKKYIKDGTKIHGETCKSCGGSNLIRVEGCLTCVDCGSSKCG